MISFISGLIIAAIFFGIFLYLRPRNGEVHPLVVKPVFEWIVPVVLLGGIAFGGALMFSAL